jgi:N-acetylglucosaminyldiphosphoundecaprenol N-acetyl-beta-D-mannosaminyltransferase
MLKKKILLGVGITAANTSTILEHVLEMVYRGEKKLFIVTPNPEILVYAQRHLDYKDKLNSADIALADGSGILAASLLLGLGIPQRTTGVDFIEELCKVSREKPLSMGFLGGRSGVALRTAECLKQKYPWINVVFTGEEWLDKDVKTQKTIDILFVAYGFPKQEQWIYEHLQELPVTAAIGVGGAFDYISGAVPRAPRPMRSLGLEWFFRLMLQPKRIKRQLALPLFVFLILKERFIK